METSLLLCFFSLLILDSPSTSMKLDINVTVPLSNLTKLSSSYSSQLFQSFSSNSRITGRVLVHQNSKSFSLNFPIFPLKHAYLIPLNFGTPPQLFIIILDTGSGLTWFPCGPNFSCYNCSSCTKDTKGLTIFNPAISSSSKYLGCNSPKSRWLTHQRARCRNCKANNYNSQNCLQPLHYKHSYMKGFTAGVYLSETFTFEQHVIPDLVVGCSSISSHPPIGTVGFSRGLLSLPSQLGLKRFSYCLAHHQYDGVPQKTPLVLNGDSRPSGLSYTAFHSTPSTENEYYHVVLDDIIISQKSFKIPRKMLLPKKNGYGGTVLDTGTTYTFMDKSIFQRVTREFEKQLGGRETFTSAMKNTRPCFNFSANSSSSIPNLAYRFKDGATMELHLSNYLIDGDGKDIKCLSIMPLPSSVSRGPVVILGNIQQRDFFMEYDLKNERLGFRAEKCT